MINQTHTNWDAFALLLIDVQRDFWPEESARAFPNFPNNIAVLLTLCRKLGIEIIHLRASFNPDQSDWMPKFVLRGRIPCVQGTSGEEVLPFAAALPGETVMLKQTFDGFLNPALLPYLRQKGKRFLLTAGLVTSTCVLFTTASAMQHGFLVAVVEDCCADEPPAHQNTLDAYPFIFERTRVEALTGRYAAWVSALQQLDAGKAAGSPVP